MLKVKRLTETAQLPVRGSEMAAGYDLCADENLVIRPGEWKAVSTGLAIAVPPGWYGRIAPRSGLAVKQGISVLAGVVDSDYRGEVKIVLANWGYYARELIVVKGERIAQLVIERCMQCEVYEVPDLDGTGRGEAGFGSTGMAPLPPG